MLSLTEKVGLSSKPNVLDRETEMIESLPSCGGTCGGGGKRIIKNSKTGRRRR